ncbi:MAG: CarD family transcriptional regulator [Oscillospiraceae bacterium]|nr:CarD family transcriptional regulator [Oscillospiraceae bacterium]
MYTVGNKIVHPLHGAGTIDNIITQTIDGTSREYYVVKLHTNNMTIMVPVATSKEIGIRDVISSEEADKLLSLFSTIETDDVQNWNRRYRDNATKIKSGDLNEVVRVIKSLSIRDIKSGLSTGERKMLHSARQILVSELILAKGTTKQDIENLLDVALSGVIKEQK